MNVCVYVCSPVRYTTPEIAHCTQIKTAEYSIGQAKMHATLELVSTHANVPRVVAGFWVLDLPTVGILAPVRMIWYKWIARTHVPHTAAFGIVHALDFADLTIGSPCCLPLGRRCV